MSTMPHVNPKSSSPWAGDRPKTKRESRHDLVGLLMLVLVFAALIALIVLAAVLGPPPTGGQFQLPIMP